MKAFLPVTLLGAVMGCGLMAGLFFAFSVCVMKALGQLPPSKGIAAMQAINAAILNPVFFAVFMGTAAVCVLVLLACFLRWYPAPVSRCLLAGSVVYLVGVLLVTAIVNVPLNDALAAVNPDSSDSARLWAGYLTNWTAWNHVRTVAALVATALFGLALYQKAQS